MSSFVMGMNIDMLARDIGHINLEDFAKALSSRPELLRGLDDAGRTLLISAVVFGRSDLVTVLLEKPETQQSDILNIRDELVGWAAIHYAAFNEDAIILAKLLNAEQIDYDLPTKDSPENTALHFAGRNNSSLCYELLKQKGASESINKIHETPTRPQAFPLAISP